MLPMGLEPFQGKICLLSGFKLDRFDVGSRSHGEFILQHNLWDKKINRKWNILNIYGATHDEDRDTLLADLASFSAKIKTLIWWVATLTS
jgi:hypothetical protein